MGFCFETSARRGWQRGLVSVGWHDNSGGRCCARGSRGGAGVPGVPPCLPGLGNRAPPRGQRTLLLAAPRAFLGDRHGAWREDGRFQFRREGQRGRYALGEFRRQPGAAVHHCAAQAAITAHAVDEEVLRPELGAARALGEAGMAQALQALERARAGAAAAMHAATGLALDGGCETGAAGARAGAAARGEMEVGIASALGGGRWRRKRQQVQALLSTLQRGVTVIINNTTNAAAQQRSLLPACRIQCAPVCHSPDSVSPQTN